MLSSAQGTVPGGARREGVSSYANCKAGFDPIGEPGIGEGAHPLVCAAASLCRPEQGGEGQQLNLAPVPTLATEAMSSFGASGGCQFNGDNVCGTDDFCTVPVGKTAVIASVTRVSHYRWARSWARAG